ncbi:MAGEA9B isoform 2, partial [Pongo abelii]
MSLEQRSPHCKPDEDLEAQGEDLGLMGAQDPTGEEQETTSSSDNKEEEVSAAGSSSPPQSPQGGASSSTSIYYTLWSQFDEGSSSQEEEGPSTSVDPAHLEFMFQEALKLKVAELVRFLLHKYRVKEPVTKAEMLESVIKNYKHYFPVIFGKASEFLQLIFGTDVKEVDPAGHSYILVTALGLSCDSMLGDGHSMP